MKSPITIETTIDAPVETVWKAWTEPAHITTWCHASDDWHAPSAENDLKVGGSFKTRMESIDGKEGFDFSGIYTHIEPLRLIEYSIEGGRKVRIEFMSEAGGTKIVETFEPENENPIEMQKAGWQVIMDNFKKHVAKA